MRGDKRMSNDVCQWYVDVTRCAGMERWTGGRSRGSSCSSVRRADDGVGGDDDDGEGDGDDDDDYGDLQVSLCPPRHSP
jgi:hypothetical protein